MIIIESTRVFSTILDKCDNKISPLKVLNKSKKLAILKDKTTGIEFILRKTDRDISQQIHERRIKLLGYNSPKCSLNIETIPINSEITHETLKNITFHLYKNKIPFFIYSFYNNNPKPIFLGGYNPKKVFDFDLTFVRNKLYLN